MELRITGASAFVNRMYEACTPYQWAREFTKNSLEAGATQIEFGIEWQAVEKWGRYRRVIADNGHGMSAEELVQFFSTLGAGGKKIGGVHDNFGVGAKVASLPWNPEGIVVVSYKNGRPSMIEIVYDNSDDAYHLVEFDIGAGKTCVVDPSAPAARTLWQETSDIDWASVRPAWMRDHGTIIVLKGSRENPHTALGNVAGGEEGTKGLSIYLNSRFWDLSGCEVRVSELRGKGPASWPKDRADRDDGRRPNNRRAWGARKWIEEPIDNPRKEIGNLAHRGDMWSCDERVIISWYLWDGERPDIHQHARKSGYIAIRYKDELYEISDSPTMYRNFGVVEGAVRRNLWIVIEPKLFSSSNGRWGVHPDQARNRLIFTGDGDKGVPVPTGDWGLEFADRMPQPILDAIQAARGDMEGTIESEEYRKRLQDKFGSRWKVPAFVKSITPRDDSEPANGDEEEDSQGERGKGRQGRRNRLRRYQRALRGGADQGHMQNMPVDVPRFEYAKADDFSKAWHLAAWVPNHPKGPTVVLNAESPILEDIIRHHRDQYPDVYGEEVTRTVREVFGQIAICKVAHAQKLTQHLAEYEVDERYRNEESLTISLMGLLAEETVIALHLGRLGKKKVAA